MASFPNKVTMFVLAASRWEEPWGLSSISQGQKRSVSTWPRHGTSVSLALKAFCLNSTFQKLLQDSPKIAHAFGKAMLLLFESALQSRANTSKSFNYTDLVTRSHGHCLEAKKSCCLLESSVLKQKHLQHYTLTTTTMAFRLQDLTVSQLNNHLFFQKTFMVYRIIRCDKDRSLCLWWWPIRYILAIRTACLTLRRPVTWPLGYQLTQRFTYWH